VARLAGEVALVIGGTRGVGAAVVRRFVEEGCKVAFCGRSEELGAALIAELRQAAGEAHFIPCDLSRPDEIREVVEGTIAAFGSQTILVNNAAATGTMEGLGDTVDLAEQDWSEYIRQALTHAVFLPVKYSVPNMIAAGHGSIVNIASANGIRGTRGPAPYVAAKGAELALTRHWALVYARHRIRCNALALGFVDTGTATIDMIKADPELFAVYRDAHLLGTGEPDDVAYAALWLASPESRWITGTVIPVEGGATSYIPSARQLISDEMQARRSAQRAKRQGQ